MFAQDKHDKSEALQGAPAENHALVSAIFGAVAVFTEPAEEKLKAFIRAGKIAEAFLASSNSARSKLEPEADTTSSNPTTEGPRHPVLSSSSNTYTLSH